MSKQSRRGLKKPGGDVSGGIRADGEGGGILQAPGLLHRSSVRPKIKNYMSGEIIQL